MKRTDPYTVREEILNCVSHGAGLIMGLAVCIFFLIKGSASDSWLTTFSLILYMIGVCSSYASSTIYHAIPASNVKAKALARHFDHAAIYLHIAGSYSPITLIAIRTGGAPVWAWVIFGFVWICALVGISTSFRKLKTQSYLETVCYVLMGLTILIALKPFYDTCGLGVVLWVVGEGVAYIIGAVAYSFKKLKYVHTIFHVFVIIGDICHMIATWMVIKMFILG